jgi:hypothetical protein
MNIPILEWPKYFTSIRRHAKIIYAMFYWLIFANILWVVFQLYSGSIIYKNGEGMGQPGQWL